MPQRCSLIQLKAKESTVFDTTTVLRQLSWCLSHKSQVKMEGLTSTTTTETLVNLEEPPPSEFADIFSTETTPELTSSILIQTLLNNTTLSTDEILQDLKDTTENLEALARNETIGEQELKEWQKTSKCIIQVILQWWKITFKKSQNSNTYLKN